jgi:hypothetical protein
MICPIATNLFEDYASAVMALFDATDRLANLVGQPGPFEDERKCAEGAGKMQYCPFSFGATLETTYLSWYMNGSVQY